MIYYYVKSNGDLGEQLTVVQPVAGSQNYNTIYVFWDNDTYWKNNSSAIAYIKFYVSTYPGPTSEVQMTISPEQIDFGGVEDVDLKFFKENTTYKFAKLTIPGNVLSQNGWVRAVIRIFENPQSVTEEIAALDDLTFKVNGTNMYDSNLTESQYNYLLSRLTQSAIDDRVVHKAGEETITGQKTFQQSIIVSTNQGIGSGSTSNINFNISGLDVSGNIVPHINNSYNLGSLGYKWNTIHVNTINDLSTSNIGTKTEIQAETQARTEGLALKVNTADNISDAKCDEIFGTGTGTTSWATKGYVDNAISTLKANAYIKVDTTAYPTLQQFLASTGEEGKTYLYPVDVSDVNKGYYQYIWELSWVSLGTTKTDTLEYTNKTTTPESKSNLVIVKLTQAQYDALTPDSNTLYLIVEE